MEDLERLRQRKDALKQVRGFLRGERLCRAIERIVRGEIPEIHHDTQGNKRIVGWRTE